MNSVYYAFLIRVSLAIRPSHPSHYSRTALENGAPTNIAVVYEIDSLSGLCLCLFCGNQLLKKACNHVRKMGGTRVASDLRLPHTANCARPDGASDTRVTAD